MICHQEITSAHLVVSPRIYNSQNEQTEYRAADHAEQRQRRLHHYIAHCVARHNKLHSSSPGGVTQLYFAAFNTPWHFCPGDEFFFQFCSKCIGVSHAYTYLAKFNWNKCVSKMHIRQTWVQLKLCATPRPAPFSRATFPSLIVCRFLLDSRRRDSWLRPVSKYNFSLLWPCNELWPWPPELRGRPFMA